MKDVDSILHSVDQFYSNAFGQLILLTICSIGMIGVIVPLVVSYLQTRALKMSQEAVEEKLKERFAGLKGELERSLSGIVGEQMKVHQLEYEKRLAELEARLKREAAEAASGIYTVQATVLRGKKQFARAAKSLATACVNNIVAGNERNLKRRLRVLNKVLEELTSADFGLGESNEETDTAVQLSVLVEDLKKFDKDGNYADELNLLRRGIALAKERKLNAAVAK